MNELSLLANSLWVGGALVALGMVGLVLRRNLIVMFLCAEMMLQGVSLSLVAFGRYHGGLGRADAWDGQMLVLFILTVAACEAAIALALVLMLARRTGRLDAAAWQDLREEGQPAYVDRQLPEQPAWEPHWPHLTPAGVRPSGPAEVQRFRERV